MPQPISKSPLDEITDKLGSVAKEGVQGALSEYLRSTQGQATVKEAVGSLKTFLFVVGAALTYAAVRKK